MAVQDLRAYLARLEEAGELCHIGAEVDWDLEMGAISRRGIELMSPAFLFEKVKGYPDGYRVLANIITGSRPTHARMALALGLPKVTPVLELIEHFAQTVKSPIKPVLVDTGPCQEEIHLGNDVDLLEFPIPTIHGTDGGRYAGTWHVDVTKDPDTGWVNWGIYRHMLHDQNTLGWLANPFQHGPSIFYRGYESRGRPMPMAVAIGTDPICNIVAATGFAAGVTEVDIAGGLRGAPVELVKCRTIDLEVPATAEIVLEGMVLPGERRLEGQFGEWTGYNAGAKVPRPVFRVQCITHRKNPILTMSNPGKGWTLDQVITTVTASAILKNELESRGIPFKSLYLIPPGFAVVIAAKSQYSGFVHTLASAIWSSKEAIHRPYIFVVGEDVDVTDPEDVLWCLTTRLHPERGIHVIRDTVTSALNPHLSREEKVKGVGARGIFNATFPYHWSAEETPTVIDFEHGWPAEIREKVLSRWQEYGVPEGNA